MQHRGGMCCGSRIDISKLRFMHALHIRWPHLRSAPFDGEVFSMQMTHAILGIASASIAESSAAIHVDSYPFCLSDFVCFSSWKNLSGDGGLERELPKTSSKTRAGPDVEPLTLRADCMVNDLRGRASRASRASRSSYADPADL